MIKKIFIAIVLIAMLFTSASAVMAQTPQSITLKPGFTFVSFTNALSITPAQFKALNSAIEDVYLYSAVAGSFLSISEGTLTSLAAGKGYIVKSSASSNFAISVPGNVISSIGNITLKTGFNLVGFSKVPASMTFKQLMEAYSMIKGIYKWSPAAGSFIQVIRDTNGTVVLLDSTDPSFTAGDSYFFNLTSDTSINYDGTSIVVGATPVNPNAAPATISGTINSAAGMAELGLSYQAAGEEFDVTLVDYDGNAVPSISLDAGETNPKTVKDGQAYSFKTKDFTKSYKIIAKSKTTQNKMLSTFVGKVKENESVPSRDVNPIATAMSMIYADPTKDAATYKQEEQAKKQDQTFMKRLAPVVADLEAKRSSSLGNLNLTSPAKLEQAYKDAILGSTNPQEIAKIKEGLDAVIGQLEEQLSIMAKLKDALSLVATSGRRQNETFVKESKTKIKNILTAEATDPLKDTTNKQTYKEAKISFGLVCCDLGDIFKNKVSSTTASGAPNMMAAYQALDSGIDPKAKAEYEEGYNAVKGLTFDENDKAKGLDDAGNAAILKNASELAKTDPAMLDEAKKKADVISSEMETEGKAVINLPTGEALPKDRILAEKGEALINGGRPTEAVDVFEDVTEPRIKNFGLGRAYLQLNDLEFAYKNLKDSVKDIVKSNNGFENRMNVETQFARINEALFAFAAVLDKLKNGTETDVMQIKNKIKAEEQLEGSSEQILDDPNVTLGKVIKDIKPTTSFFEVGKKFADGQTGFGGQFVNVTQETDTLKKAFQDASKLMFKANQYIDKARNASTEADRKRFIYEGKTAGTIDAPADDTAFKYLIDAENAFKAIFANAAVIGPMKGDAHYHLGLAFMAHYRGYKSLNMENKELIAKAKEVFLNIQSSIYDAEYLHLQFAITQMLKTMENFEKEMAGVVVEAGTIYQTAEKLLERAETLYFDGQSSQAMAEFEKAFVKFDESYKSTDVKITAKMKEAALYYSGYCLFYKFKLMTTADETVKIKVMERLKLFKLKFPNSEFANAAGDMVNDVTSNVSTLGPIDANMAKPGAEFSKAISLMEKLRLYYRNNFSTTEIETAFNQAKFIFETIAVQLTNDSKYIGTYADPKFAAALKDFRAHAKFMLAILYMERYAMPMAKEVNYKNLALQYFNDLVMNDYTQPFIPDVKRFISQLKEEIKAEFSEGDPIITELFINQHVLSVDQIKTGTAQLTLTAGVVIPDAASGATIASVTAELKKFGNTVFNDAGTALKDLAFTKIPSTVAGGPEKWELKFTPPKNLEIGPYDFKVTAKTSGSKTAESYAPFVVEGQTTYARITNVNVMPNGGTSHVFNVSVSHAPSAAFVEEPGKYTDVYVSVMVQQYGSMMPSLDYPQDIKLTRGASTATNDFVLDIAKELPNLKQGSYTFLFKLVNFNPADPVNSLLMPVDARPFDFFVQSTLAGADNQIVLNLYNKVLENFNSTKTAADKVAAFEKMFDTALPTEMKTALTTAFTSAANLNFAVVGTPFVQYENNYNGEMQIAVYAPWKVTGTYSKDVLTGVILPDGKMILPPGRTGAQIMNFMIEGNFSFAKRYANGVETWLITLGGAENTAPVTSAVAKITSFAGVPVPAAGGQITVPSLANIPMVEVKGENLQSYEPEVKRVLRILGPNLQFPIVLSDSGSYEWQSTYIKFTSDKLKGLKGVYNLEMLDSKYGPIANIPLNFVETTAVTASAVLFQITSGTNSAQPFNLIRPFEIDRTYDLVIKGDKLKPATGTYSLRYYNMTSAGTTPTGSMATMFVSFAVSTDATWTGTMITVPKAMLPSSSILTDGMPTSIVVWDDAKNMPASSQVPVVFLSQANDLNKAQAVINTVNGYDAKSAVMIDKKSTDTTGNIDVIGSGFTSFTSRHLDLVLQINGRPVHIPIAYSAPMTAAGTTSPTAADWSDNYIKGTINYNMPIPVMDPTMPAGEMLGTAVTKYPCGLLIWDDKLQAQVTPFMVSLKFMATTTTMPVISKVNGFEFYGSPIELTTSITDLKIEGQNFGEQSAIGNKGLYLKSQPTPMNPMPTLTPLGIMSWSNTMISATIPAAMAGGIYELFIGETSVASPMTYVDPSNVKPVSKIVLVNFKSTDTAVTSAFISNIEAYGSAAAPIVTSSTAASVAVPSEVTSIKFMGKGLVSTTGTFRTLYMKLKGTNDWKYLAGSNSILWTDNAITVKLYEPKPVGAFEIFIAETDFGAVTVSNIVNLVFGQAAGGATINSINSIAITPGMLVTLKSDFTQLEIMGMNFGVQSANLIVRFVPFPDPTNPNPIPFVFPTSSWSESFIKVGRPELPAGAKLMKGNIELFNKTLNKTIAVPVPVEFIDSTATNIPAVTGLKYDATMKKLMWNPATSATSSMMYAYILNIDGMIYEVPMGIYDFPVNMLQSGDHKAMVQAKIPGTYPPQAGPFSSPITFSTTGGTASTIPAVTGITYDPMMKIIKWVPVQTVTAEGWTQYYVYIVEIDGAVIPNPMSMAEYPVMNLTSGAHKVRVQAQKPGSYPPESGPFSAPFSFTLEGGTGTAVPMVTGLAYDAAMNKLKWNPVTNTTTAAPYAYNLEIDGTFYGPFYMNEFFMPPHIPAGSHTAKIQAMMEAMPPQYGAFSTPITFTSVAGTTTGVPNIMTLTYESAMKKLMWTTDAPAATMGVTYFVSLDNQNPMPVQMMEFYMPPAFSDGKHTAKVWAQAFVNNMPIEGTPKMLEFTVGSTTGSLMAPVITYDSATKMLSWSPVTAPVAGAVVEYKILVNGIEKMTWAQTSINLGNTSIISDWTVNNVITVKAVVYSLNLQSGPSNAVNTLGGTTGTGTIVGINAMNGEIMVNFDAAPMPAPVMADFAVKQSINGAPDANVMPTSIMPYGSSIKLMVPMIQPTNVAQSIKVSVSYKGGAVKTATYSIPAGTTGGMSVTFDKQGGPYPNAMLEVLMTASPATAFIWYTNDGSDPKTSTTKITATIAGYPVKVMIPAGMANYKIRAVATDQAGNFGTVVEQIYSTTGTGGTTTAPHMPLIAPMDVSVLTAGQGVTLTADPADYMVMSILKIKYTIDGSVPTMTSPEYTAGMQLMPPTGATSFTVKAVAVNGTMMSEVSSKTYSVGSGTAANLSLTFSPMGGAFPNADLTVTITPTPAEAKVLYTIDGSNPPMSDPYATVGAKTITVPAGKQEFVIKAFVHLNGQTYPTTAPYVQTYSTMGSGTTTLPNLTFAPAAVPAGGTSYSGTAPMTVTITMPGDIASTSKIKYTMDAAMDPKNGMDYPANGIPLNTAGSYTIKAVAVDMATGTVVKSNSATMTYTVTTGGTTLPNLTFAPAAVPAGGTSYSGTAPMTVTITMPWDIASTSKIKYTMDAAMDPKNGMDYPTNGIPLNIAGSYTIKAVAVDMATGTIVKSNPATMTYNLTGGTAITVPDVTGVTYDSTSKKIKWNSVSVSSGAYVMYDVKIGTTEFAAAAAMTEFDVTQSWLGLTAGQSYTYAVRAKVPTDTGHAYSNWVSGTDPSSFVLQAAAVPEVMGVYYDMTGNKIMWQPVTGPATYSYTVIIDGTEYSAGSSFEFPVPTSIVGGPHGAQVKAKDTNTQQFGPLSPPNPIQFTVGGPAAPKLTGSR